MSLEVCSLPSPTGPWARSHNIRNPSLETTRSLETCSSNKTSASSRFRDLVKFLSSVSGDLSNVTAPPFFLAPSSVVEVGHCWSQRPGVFAAPALEPDPARRSLLVLRMILISMRSQFYIAGSPTVSIKKPLNAFLGELFLASWTHTPKENRGTARGKEKGISLGMDSGDGKSATTRLVAEQVSHHPPITAMAIIDDDHGIRADGYARVEMTFSSSVDIRQVGHAILHIDKYDEDYLIPLPDVKVRGFLSGRLYPEVLGTYTIVSSSGYVSEMTFSGAGVFRGKKNTFEVKIYRKDDPKKKPIYEVAGVWSEGWTVKDSRTGEVLERYDVDAAENRPAPMDIDPIEKQDPWESRRAWAGVIDALNRGDFRDTIAEKSRLEQAQRQMRDNEKKNGETWEPLLFTRKDGDRHEIFHQLAKGTDWKLFEEKTKGVWKVDDLRISRTMRPFRGEYTPLG
ncbi:Protein kes1 [Cytospora mali]|uniref:Protein kes1 n=1 Tax=Cytospora mali TaxID=578113 RepID=A0A194UUS2_CYTMA|nr:Protein kes1 [Valsa mali var. pyri (nom. inval.)]